MTILQHKEYFAFRVVKARCTLDLPALTNEGVAAIFWHAKPFKAAQCNEQNIDFSGLHHTRWCLGAHKLCNWET